MVPAVILLVQTIASLFGFSIDFGEISNRIIDVINALFIVLTILGIVTDPTTKGISDSERALGYLEPNED
jgi:phi LC3 family holin